MLEEFVEFDQRDKNGLTIPNQRDKNEFWLKVKKFKNIHFGIVLAALEARFYRASTRFKMNSQICNLQIENMTKIGIFHPF